MFRSKCPVRSISDRSLDFYFRSSKRGREDAEKNRENKKLKLRFCSLFNSVTGCSYPQSDEGCVRPGNKKLHHGCSAVGEDGKHCDSKAHNKHGHGE